MLGRHHPFLKRIRTLRRDPARRRAEGVVVAEGVRVVEAALAAGASIETALVSPRLERTDRGRALRDRLDAARIPVETASDRDVDRVQDARGPQPVVALIRWRSREGSPPDDGSPASGLVLLTVNLQDPGNLGALIRTSDAAGADAVVVAGDGVDPTHPRVVRSAAGSLFRMPVFREPDPVAAARALRASGYRLLAAGPRSGTPLREVRWRGRIA